MQNRKNIMNFFNNFDKFIFFSVILLMLAGIFAVFSASTRIDEKYDLLFKKHLIFCFLGFIMICFLSRFSIKNLIFISIFFFCFSLLLSFSTIMFFPETKGASRWIKFLGLSFQPSEIIKPSFIIVSSLLLSRFKTKNDFSFIINIFFFILIGLILLRQPDFGMFLLLFFVWIIQIFNSKLDIKILAPIITIFIGVFILIYFLLDHVRFRINNFFFGNVGDNYQINKSLESFANGGLFGQGLGNGSISKNLPDAHSDFIFALIGEEFGILGIFIIICLYLIIYLRIFFISHKSNNFFVLNSTLGLGNIFIFQTIINISTSINLLPTKGMTLPFISYGGSSFLSNAIIIGFIMVLLKVIKNE
ncbi:MAG: hypothetical protein CMP38_03080 [Rickettsiales bacterium]|nr:hypothetical protein [Rickettsiales bacterium]